MRWLGSIFVFFLVVYFIKKSLLRRILLFVFYFIIRRHWSYNQNSFSVTLRRKNVWKNFCRPKKTNSFGVCNASFYSNFVFTLKAWGCMIQVFSFKASSYFVNIFKLWRKLWFLKQANNIVHVICEKAELYFPWLIDTTNKVTRKILVFISTSYTNLLHAHGV